MKINFHFILIVLSSLIIISCGSKDQEDETPLPDTLPEPIEGIIMTDINGALIGGSDSTDWMLDLDWVPQEENIFQESNLPLCDISNEQFYPAYPNPCLDIIYLALSNFPTSAIEVAIVDTLFSVEAQFTADIDPTSSGFAIDVTGLEPNNIYRIYYRISDSDCEYRGFGDFIKN